jgi:hypothetical protein
MWKTRKHELKWHATASAPKNTVSAARTADGISKTTHELLISPWK